MPNSTHSDPGFKPGVTARLRISPAVLATTPDEPEVWATIHDALEQHDLNRLSEARRALRRRKPNTILLPLAAPPSPSWLGGVHHG